MSQILSSEILSDRPQADGRRYIRAKFVAEDHDLGTRDVYYGPRLVPSDFNANAWLSAEESVVLEGLALEEDEGGLDVTSVADPLVYALNPKWSTTKRIAKVMIYWMMDERNTRAVLYLETLIVYIQQNYNAAQIAVLLDITIEQVQRVNRRVNAILTDVGTVKDLTTDYDVEEGGF